MAAAPGQPERRALAAALMPLGGRLAEVIPQASDSQRSRVAGFRGSVGIISVSLGDSPTFVHGKAKAQGGSCPAFIGYDFERLAVARSEPVCHGLKSPVVEGPALWMDG
ncbi:MAG: hypothetical protein AB7P42_09395 [Gammaproteobacteria bacterium]